MENTIIPYLFLATFVLVLLIGVWQYRRTRKARAEHHQSASARANHESPVGDAPRQR